MDAARTQASADRPVNSERSVVSATLHEALAHVDAVRNIILARLLDVDDDMMISGSGMAADLPETQSVSSVAAERARLESEKELGDSRAQVARLTTELECHREQTGHSEARRRRHDREGLGSEAPEGEPSAGGSGRSELDKVQRALQASRAESRDLGRRIQAEKEKYARLIAAVRAVQRIDPAAAADSNSAGTAEPWLVEPADSGEPVGEQSRPAVNLELTVPASEVDGRTVSDAAAGQTAPTSDVDPTLDFNPLVYATDLLRQIETVYEADTSSGLPFDQLVDRLTGNLTYAAAVFARRVRLSGAAATVFDQQLTVMDEAQAETVFGRHLRAASYEYRRQRGEAQTQVA